MPKTNDVVATATEDGHAIVGGRPASPEFIEQRQRQASGLPPVGALSEQRVPEPVEGLPFVHVARQVVGREIQRLRAKVDGIERELARGVLGVQGIPVPHLAEAHKAAEAELVRLREEIERLTNLTDLEARQRAFEHGAR